MTAGVWSFFGLQKFPRLGRDEGPHLSAVSQARQEWQRGLCS